MKSAFINIWIVVGIAVAVLLAGGYAVISQQRISSIASFEECAAAGYPIMESYPEQCRTPDGRIFVKIISSQNVSFGIPFELKVGGQVTFADNLNVILSEIKDSRCQPDVVCIWAGELSPILRISGGNVGIPGKDVQLGTTNNTSVTESGYIFTLKGATETTATIVVTGESGRVGCTKELKICPDGSHVGRVGPNCEFAKCPSPVACTMDAKLCPDGSYVGRTGPNCEFAACPAQPAGTQVILREGERRGPLLVQKIFPAYITGLVYREYPVATDQGSEITMYIGDSASNGCTHTLTLIKIENGSATFTEKIDNSRPCPICLSEGTLIDTPAGEIAVEDLMVGDKVWSIDLAGRLIASPILAVVKTPVPLTHQVVHLKLADGRELFVSPGHPAADGRLIGNLLKGDALDGSSIVEIEKVAYSKAFTYDILPAGGTGAYFANGILIGSTLK